MQNKYCLPIQKPSKQAVIDTLKQHRHSYSYFEVWLDYIEDFDMDFLDDLYAQLQDKLVVVFRRQNLEPIVMPLSKRLRILEHLHDTSVLVDLDITSQQPELEYLTANHLRARTIVSYHNYDKTPSQDVIETIVKRISATHPTILKIAAFCQTEMDALRLMQLLLTLRGQNQRCIILGMGHHGLVTRIFGTLWGNELIFAPDTLLESSAPGQLTRKQLDTINTILKG